MLIQKREIQQVSNELMNMLHEDELEVVNDLHDAVLAKDIEKIDELFKALLVETEVHFKTEEDLMEQSEFTGFQVHKSDHDTMRAKLKNYHDRWEILKGPKELRGFLETEYKKWVILHISKWDSDAALHLG